MTYNINIILYDFVSIQDFIMPLIRIEHINDNVSYGLWKIEENADLLLKNAYLSEYEDIEFQKKIKLQETFSKVILESNPRLCLFELTEQRADAALIPLTNYEILKDLLPKLKQTTRILSVSQKIPLAAGCYFGDVTTEEEVKPIFEAALNIHKTPAGEQAMMVFKAERWEKVSFSTFQPLIQALSKRHKK